MLSVIIKPNMLKVDMLNIIILRFIVLNFVMLSVIMLNIGAPPNKLECLTLAGLSSLLICLWLRLELHLDGIILKYVISEEGRHLQETKFFPSFLFL